ncbi:MAG: UpxY family transcription antiterminator [Chitinophagaceae bacterium]|nr:UpxY family transcription antiterminator [Chitinophagaceae bacterium]
MNEEKKWFVVYTKSRCEKKVVENLTKAGIENYLPLRKEIVQWSDRKKVVEKIIIPSYVFVKIKENEYRDVRMINGVVNFVYWNKKPAILKSNEIRNLKLFIENEGKLIIENYNTYLGNIVIINEGIFSGYLAEITQIKQNKIVLVLTSLKIKLTIKKK